MSEIEQLALDLLDQRELQLAKHLSLLLGDDKWDVGPLVEEILPVYWEKMGDILQNLEPGSIYRSLYYIHKYSAEGNFKNCTRSYMTFISNHLEGCLLYLTPFPPEHRGPSKPFGRLVKPLKQAGVLSEELAEQLWKFNAAVNVPSKHFDAYMPTRRLDERTFSVMEAAYAFVLMRRLSMQLFGLLQANGVSLPHGWPEFKDGWLSWFHEFNNDPDL